MNILPGVFSAYLINIKMFIYWQTVAGSEGFADLILPNNSDLFQNGIKKGVMWQADSLYRNVL